MSDNINVDHSE